MELSYCRLGFQGELKHIHTVFLRSDATATSYFAYHFVRLLFEGSVYLFGKPGDINDGWIGYKRVRP